MYRHKNMATTQVAEAGKKKNCTNTWQRERAGLCVRLCVCPSVCVDVGDNGGLTQRCRMRKHKYWLDGRKHRVDSKHKAW